MSSCNPQKIAWVVDSIGNFVVDISVVACNAPMGGVWPDIGKGVRLLGKSTGSYGKPEIMGFTSPKVGVQAWPLSNATVQEELL